MQHIVDVEEPKITKEMVDRCALFNTVLIGDVLLSAMGYNAKCTSFNKGNDGTYVISYLEYNGGSYIEVMSYEQIEDLVNKSTFKILVE